MTTNKNTLEDLYYEVALAEPSERINLVDSLTRAHPDHARELTDFAAALAIDHARTNSSAPQAVAENDPLVMKAMSKLQNRLYEVDKSATSRSGLMGSLRSALQERVATNPFASLTHVEIRDFVKTLNVNTVLFAKLRDRLIRPETIPAGFRTRAAEALRVPDQLLAAHFAGSGEIQAGTFFNSSQKPDATKQETFAEAVASSGLNEEQQRHLLSL